MIESRNSISAIIKYSLLLLVSLFIGSIAALLTLSIVANFGYGRLGVTIVLSLLSGYTFYYGIKIFQRIKINISTRVIEVIYFNTYSKHLAQKTPFYYKKTHAYVNNIQIETLIIIDDKGNRVSFNSEQYKNYKELAQAVDTIGRYIKDLKTKTAITVIKYIFFNYLLILIIAMLIKLLISHI